MSFVNSINNIKNVYLIYFLIDNEIILFNN